MSKENKVINPLDIRIGNNYKITRGGSYLCYNQATSFKRYNWPIRFTNSYDEFRSRHRILGLRICLKIK